VDTPSKSHSLLNHYNKAKNRTFSLLVLAMLNYFRPLPQSSRQLQNGLIDLVDLRPFDVQLARLETTEIDFISIHHLVTEWMNDSYENHLAILGYTGHYAAFDTVILLQRVDRNRLLRTSDQLYTAAFKGAGLFTRNTTELAVPPEVIHFVQENTLHNMTGLLALLQLSNATGLGSNVVDVNAFTVAMTDSEQQDGPLHAIIIVAVVVAALAFLFLLAAIWWAWRYDKQNRESYLSSKNRRQDPTASASSEEATKPSNSMPVNEIGADDGPRYAESVISEDISTSISQYYRSGPNNYSSAMAGRGMNHLSDAASVSSMESYGYSLDGYAPSMMTKDKDKTKEDDEDEPNSSGEF
jgi:hypothetical protein